MHHLTELALESFVASDRFLVIKCRVITIMSNLLLGLQSSIVFHSSPRAAFAPTVITPNLLSFRSLLPEIVEAHNVRVREIGLHMQSNKSMFGSVLRNTFLKLDEIGFA
jgi:hypothetical protein